MIMSSLFQQLNAAFNGVPSVEDETDTTVVETTETTAVAPEAPADQAEAPVETNVEGVDSSAVVEADASAPTVDVLTATPEAETSADSVETALIETAEANQPVEALTQGVDEAVEVVEAVEALVTALESTLETGGIDGKARTMMAFAIESYAQRLGTTFTGSKVAAIEAFDDVNSRYDATVASIEDIQGFLSNVGKGITEAAYRIFDGIRNTIGTWVTTQDKMIARAKAIQAALKELKADEINKEVVEVADKYARAFWFEGKVQSPVACAKRNLEVLDLVAKNWNVREIMDSVNSAAKSLVPYFKGEDVDGNVKELKLIKPLFTQKAEDKYLNYFQGKASKAVANEWFADFYQSKELPGGKIFLETAIKVDAKTTDSVSWQFRPRGAIALFDVPGYTEANGTPVKVATPGDLKMITDLVIKTCEAMKEILRKMDDFAKQKATVEAEFKAAYKAAEESNRKGMRKPIMVVSKGIVDIAKFAKQVNDHAMKSTKNILDYCETSLRHISKGVFTKAQA